MTSSTAKSASRWCCAGCILGLGLGVCWALSAAAFAPPEAPVQEQKANENRNPRDLRGAFDANVRLTLTDDALIVESDGIPTHKTGTFPNATNPNRILKQDYRFYIPRNPQKAKQPTPTPFGPIGVAINGIPFYNPYNAQGRDAVLGPFAEIFDSCCGHPDPMGRYHYHKYPVCVKSPFRDPEGAHSPLIGYAFDGFALYGPNGEDGRPPADLDDCNGHEDKERGYHYHVTAEYPYLIGAYRGVPDERNFDRPRRGGPGGNFAGGPPGGGPPPPPPVVVALDEDRDGTISPKELARAATALLTLDRDHDGSLSPAELMPPGGRRAMRPRPGLEGRPPRPDGPPLGPPADEPGPRRGRPGGPGGLAEDPPPPPPPPPPPFVEALDADHDGIISAAEIKRAPIALKSLDRNGDGSLSREELRPRGGPPGGRGRPGGPPPPDRPPPPPPPEDAP